MAEIHLERRTGPHTGVVLSGYSGGAMVICRVAAKLQQWGIEVIKMLLLSGGSVALFGFASLLTDVVPRRP